MFWRYGAQKGCIMFTNGLDHACQVNTAAESARFEEEAIGLPGSGDGGLFSGDSLRG